MLFLETDGWSMVERLGRATNNPPHRLAHALSSLPLLLSSPLPSSPFPSPQRFNPKFANAKMRSKLSDGHPKDPLIIYVGRLGAEKRLRDLKGVLER